MNRKRGFKERIVACLMAALMVVGVVPLDFAGMGVQEAKADGTVYTLDMSNMGDYTNGKSETWSKKDVSEYFTVYSKDKGGSKVNKQDQLFADGFKASYKFSTGGGAKAGQACVGFTTGSASKVKVYWYKSKNETKDTEEREIAILGTDGKLVKDTSGKDCKSDHKSEGVGWYIDTFELLDAGTYYVGSSYSGTDIVGVTVEESSASGEKVSANVTYDGSAIASLSGKYDENQLTIKSSTDQIVFTQEPSADKVAIAAASDNVYSGTSSLKAVLDTDNKKIVIKDNSDKEVLSIPYLVEGYLNAPAIGGGESYDFAANKKVFDADVVTISDKSSPDGYILLSKKNNTKLDNNNNNSHGMYAETNFTFTVKVPAESMAKFTITGCMWNTAPVTAKYYVNESDKKEITISEGQTSAEAPSNVIKYVNTSSEEQTLKIDVNANGSYIHAVDYKVEAVPNTVSGSVGTSFAGNKLTFSSKSYSAEAEIDAEGKYTVDLSRGAEYTVSIDNAKYTINDTVDLTNAAVGEAITKNFSPELIPDVVKHPENAKAELSVINMPGDGTGAGSLTVKELGQTLSMTQVGGELPTNSMIATKLSMYAFPATADANTLEADIVLSYDSSAKTSKFVAFGVINEQNGDYKALTSAIRSNNDVVMLYSKKATELLGKSSNTAVTAAAEEKLHFKVTKGADGITLEVVNAAGKSNPKTMKYDANYVSSASDNLMYGFILNNVTATVTNMVYTAADGSVLYDQNTYYDPMGTAPVINSVSAVPAADRTKITVSWTGDEAKYDGKYVLQVLKPGATEWVDVATELTDTTYEYPVSATEGGNYKFRVCGTLGNSKELNIKNRNAWVESSVAYIEPALSIPVITLSYVSPSNSVDLSWTAASGATKYEVYRRSSDETDAKVIATVEGTSYKDTTVTAEVPYYYSVKAVSNDNYSPLSEEAWTLPTDGHSGSYDENVPLFVTKRSYNTVFNDKIIIEGIAGAPGTVSVYVNGAKQQTATVAKVYDTFTFDKNITLEKGRNEVKLVLDYNNGLQVEKTLNYVYLSDYDYVVDTSFTGTAGDTTVYGAPEYKTVTEAIAAAGSASGTKVIFIRNGEYNEKIKVSTPDITLIGEDSEKTHIYYDTADCVDISNPPDVRYAFSVNAGANNFTAENLTIENSYAYTGKGGNESAEAFYSEAGNSMLIGVRLLGYQDTLQVKKGNYYLQRCYILGNVDFMWGQACKVIFDDCDLKFRYAPVKNSGYFTAFNTDDSSAYGVVYNNCRFTSESSCGGTKYYLGRPYQNKAAVAFVNCYMGSIINKDWGYSDWSGKELSSNPEVYEATRYYECGSYGAGYAVNVNRRQISQAGANELMGSDKAGWEAKASSLASSAYSGDKYINNDGVVENAYNSSDKYSTYESDDTGLSKYNAEGFASTTGVTGGGLLKETNSNYYKVATGNEFLDALTKIKNSKGVPSVIEITSDINLGYNEIENKTAYATSILAPHNEPLLSDTLKKSGVSKVYLQDITNLTIFSNNASSIKHAALDIKQSSNVIIRNIKFDELWEWDEATSGDYDVNDWDYMTIENGSTGIWVDHCTFFKSYDGVVDIKTDASHNTPMNITISWCQFMPGSENDTFFNEVMTQLESNPGAYPYYKSLLDSGMSKQQIRDYAYGQKKTHLLGQNDEAETNTNLHVTFANNYYYDSMDRMPRVRFGTAHVYNCVMDAQYLFDARMSITNKDAAKHIVSNGASSTCDAKVLLENCYMNGIINALNSGNGSSPSGYINAINSLYYIKGVRYKLAPKVNNTLDSSDRTLKITDPVTFKSALGYSYVLRDAASLSSTVVPFTGAGVATLSTLQWEKSTYIDAVESSSNATYDNTGLPESNYSDSLGNESNSNNGSNNGNNGSGSDSSDDYDSSDDSDDVLTPDEIPGADVIQIDGVDFAQMGEISEGAAKIIASIDANGQITTGDAVLGTTETVTSTVIDKITNEKSSTIVVYASQDASISAEVINKLKDTGKTLSVGVVDENGKVNAIVTLDGSKLGNATKDFALKITADVKSDSVSNAVSKVGIAADKYAVIDIDYSGKLPGTFKIAVNVADKFADGTQLALYYNNESAGQLENQYQVTTVTGGFAEFAIDHCSQYVLVDVAAARSMITTSTIASPKTADAGHIVLWIMLMCAAVAAYFGIKASKADEKKRA